MSEGGCVIGFLLFPGVTPLDVVGPYEVLVRSGARCLLVAADQDPVECDRGMRLLPEVTLAACPPLHVLVVPGGPGQPAVMADDEMLSFVRRMSSSARWTASVCTGALVLAGAGLLVGRAATTHWLAMDELDGLGARPTGERVVWDEPFVTAAGVSAGIDMALALVGRMCGDEVAQRIQLAIEYDPQPPYDAGSTRTSPESVVAHVRQRSRFSPGSS